MAQTPHKISEPKSWPIVVGVLGSLGLFLAAIYTWPGNTEPAVLAPFDEFQDELSSDGKGPEMVVLPAGSFLMGSPLDETGRDEDEAPQRTVTIPANFAVGKYEVTWDEYEACVAEGTCASFWVKRAGGDNRWGRGNRPVIEVSWVDARRYVKWLSKETGHKYRLLSEAEWEYAARAGSETAYSSGDTLTSKTANISTRLTRRTDPVGSFAPNAFGLHDMHGNVWEWVEDCYVENYFHAPMTAEPHYVRPCKTRVLRGGSIFSEFHDLRSASRDTKRITTRKNVIGFRVARNITE